MRLIIHVALLSFFAYFSLASGRRYMKCGYVDRKCYAPDTNGGCKSLPLCPTGMKRRFTGYDCCCVLRDSYKVISSLVQYEKAKILNETLESIDNCYDKVKNISMRNSKKHHDDKHSTWNSENEDENNKKIKIEALGRKVSNVMREGINRLSMLIDVEFETILKLIFDDEHNFEDDKIGLVLKEAEEIYYRGNEVMEKITKAAKI